MRGRETTSQPEGGSAETGRAIPPPLDPSKYKGQAGKVGVVGGCTEYTGAPFFAAMSALRVGADLAHVFCTQGAGPVIKTFSPELIVHPCLHEQSEAEEAAVAVAAGQLHSSGGGGGGGEQQVVQRDYDEHAAADAVSRWFSRLDVLVVGPGLGRDPLVIRTVAEIIRRAREVNLPLVIDADGLYVVTQQPELVRGYERCILTPNVNEYRRLTKAVGDEEASGDEDASQATTPPAPGEPVSAELRRLCARLGGVTIVAKGAVDQICNGGEGVVVGGSGSCRRAGGQGDVLAGTIAVFAAWAIDAQACGRVQLAADEVLPEGCYHACRVVRDACAAAFQQHRRGMVAGDVIPQLARVMQTTFPVE